MGADLDQTQDLQDETLNLQEEMIKVAIVINDQIQIRLQETGILLPTQVQGIRAKMTRTSRPGTIDHLLKGLRANV
jgi:hypothetical protein